MRKFALFAATAFLAFFASATMTIEIQLDKENVGYWDYSRSNWMGGSSTSEDWNAATNGLATVQTSYDYHGGADRDWTKKTPYLQIDLSALNGVDSSKVQNASLNFYVENFSDGGKIATLKHKTSQSTLADGNAENQLAGDAFVADTSSLQNGWNNVDVTDFIKSDLDAGHDFSAFSFAPFAQEQDVTSTLSFHSPYSEKMVNGDPVTPSLLVTIPEPATLGLFGLAGVALAICKKRKSKD